MKNDLLLITIVALLSICAIAIIGIVHNKNLVGSGVYDLAKKEPCKCCWDGEVTDSCAPRDCENGGGSPFNPDTHTCGGSGPINKNSNIYYTPQLN